VRYRIVTKYIHKEYHSVCPLVRIATSALILQQASACVPPGPPGRLEKKAYPSGYSVRKVEDPEIRSSTLASGDSIHAFTDKAVLVSLLPLATIGRPITGRCKELSVPVTHRQVLHKHTQFHTHAMLAATASLHHYQNTTK
jgi:hypothetical protein